MKRFFLLMILCFISLVSFVLSDGFMVEQGATFAVYPSCF